MLKRVNILQKIIIEHAKFQFYNIIHSMKNKGVQYQISL